MVNDFIFKKPEEEGLDSKYVLAFLERMREYKVNLHSFMLVRNGNILTEAYYKPFHKDFPHRIYSSSKTYASIAVGMLIGEGKLCLTDRIADYFPEYMDREQHKWMKECTVEDALKMAVPILTDSYCDGKHKEWAWTFFNCQEALKPAGTVFNYNTSGTFILNVLVEKITGKPFLEYMRPVFDKIGVSKDIWCVKTPDGFSRGGSGIVTTLRDFAKFGELLLNMGEYKGEQLIPRDYMEKATSVQISNILENTYSLRKGHGYGYQIWVTEGGFSLLGMGSQFVFAFPDKNFMFVCQGDTQCSNDWSGCMIFDAVKHLLYDNLCEGQVCGDGTSNEKLNALLEGLTLEYNSSYGEDRSEFEKQIDGKKYVLEAGNPMGWKWVRFDLTETGGRLTYENERGEKKIDFGWNKYVQGTFPETHYYDRQMEVPSNRELDCMAAASWTEKTKLLLRVYITDVNMGNCFMTFGFKGDEVGIMLNKRMEFALQDYQGYAGGCVAK